MSLVCLKNCGANQLQQIIHRCLSHTQRLYSHQKSLFLSTSIECWVIKDNNMHFLLLSLSWILKNLSISGEKHRDIMEDTRQVFWQHELRGCKECWGKLNCKRIFPNTELGALAFYRFGPLAHCVFIAPTQPCPVTSLMLFYSWFLAKGNYLVGVPDILLRWNIISVREDEKFVYTPGFQLPLYSKNTH